MENQEQKPAPETPATPEQPIEKPKKPRYKRKGFLIVFIIIIILVLSYFGFRFWYFNIDQFKTKELTENILDDFDLSEIEMSTISKPTITLEQLRVPKPTKEGDAFLILQELNNEYRALPRVDYFDYEQNKVIKTPSEERDNFIRNLPDALIEIAKYKGFSRLVDVYDYPEDWYMFFTQNPEIVSINMGSSLLSRISFILGVETWGSEDFSQEDALWETALALVKNPEKLEIFLKSYLSLGQRLIESNDFETIIYLHGVHAKMRSAEALSALYKQKDENEKQDLYSRYFKELEEEKKSFSKMNDPVFGLFDPGVFGVFLFRRGVLDINEDTKEMKEALLFEEIKNEADVKNLFRKVVGIGETYMQADTIKNLIVFRAVPRATLEYALAGEVLKYYSEKSENEYIRNMAKKILDADPKEIDQKLDYLRTSPEDR